VIPWRLLDGIDIGLLGLNYTRRRNRMNGTVTATDANSFYVQVGQTLATVLNTFKPGCLS